MTGTVVAVCVSNKKGERKKPEESALLRENHGVVGDAHAGDGERQVSLLAEESIRKMQALGLDVGAGDFAENISTRGVDLPALPVGTQLAVGDAVLRVTRIGKECHSRCAIYDQAGDCVMPREGIFAVVLRGGTVRRGDPIAVIESPQPGGSSG
ncbi:MAG: MOSC domain-containing protein [Deltaproteobacteria bacterium]|nr:MOSC domain-containing protein [Deltaproteobacteria bacterium]